MGQYIGELMPEEYVLHYYKAIDRALAKKSAICSYKIQERTFVAWLTRISDRRIKVLERDVTDIPFHDIFKMF